MRHFFALYLDLQSGLLLRADIQSYSDCLQEISMFIPQTASSHNYPTRLAIWQKKAVLALECPMQGADTIVIGFDCCSFVGMNPSQDQLTGQWQIGVEAINPASLITHPGVAFRISDPDGEVGRFGSKANA